MEARAGDWSMQQRNQDWARAAAAQEALATAKSEEAEAAEPCSFILRSLYLPEQGMFRQMDSDLQLGQVLQVRNKTGPRVIRSLGSTRGAPDSWGCISCMRLCDLLGFFYIAGSCLSR